ncbi:sensor histidine kinase [Nocardia camponoti]|uniref:Two-component sensor histidine kinase n=1 Tax=Nocardia camponoti TaxID=1616106 RepID=A0A917QHV5_9NOCA|nr:sensor histidine kinase [Nocardia camponoti]GGK49747.1 two-component sensor histidine kinase [Nocardia camponoti]
MHSSRLTPVVTTMRWVLFGVMTVLAIVIAVRAVVTPDPHPIAVVVVTIVWLMTYFAGGQIMRWGNIAARRWWLVLLTVAWAVLVALTPEAVYLAFGLFFLYLNLLDPPWNLLITGVVTATTIIAYAEHRGWSVGGILGPILGVVVALAGSYCYRLITDESRAYQTLIFDLLRTQDELGKQEQEAGRLAERERLAKEIHDTVAQGLSSIQLLLHAAEQAAPDHPAVDRIRLARETAADDLAETRRLIAELAPAALDGKSLSQALERICASARSPNLATQFVVDGDVGPLPMPVEAALVRIAQSAVANVVQHAAASQMRVTLTYDGAEVHLDVVDDGVGIPEDELLRPRSGSLGLVGMRSRVEERGGAMTVDSEPGHTAVTVTFPMGAAA